MSARQSGKYFCAAVVAWCTAVRLLSAQVYGSPDRVEPGDVMIQNYLKREAEKIQARFLRGLETRENWERLRPQLKQEYFYMLGLSPLPPRTPLKATVTGSLEGEDFVVDMVHYQSRPGLYVTGNLYRPKKELSGRRLPAVLYLCGHSARGRNGNKTAFQSHGIWFARHGYICLIVDTLQLGEIAGVHHGTYSEERWWWHSRGYTPAGVECWNGMRAVDYLVSRPDVDAGRIAVTGISGGGMSSFWVAAADERVQLAIPVSGLADLVCYVGNLFINGHCDCMLFHNAFAWPWEQIAALLAPRPLLFVNSDRDPIFPMDSNERLANRLERVYGTYGAGDLVDSLVSKGNHDYRQDIRQAAFRFINTYLKNDPRPVLDSETDLVTGTREVPQHPIAPEKLRVFPRDSDIPADQINTKVDRVFVPLASVRQPRADELNDWRISLLSQLRRVSFSYFPERIPPAEALSPESHDRLETESGIEIRLRPVDVRDANAPKRILLVVTGEKESAGSPHWLQRIRQPGDLVYSCDTRGIGATRWTAKSPPNYVKRAHALLGRTVDTGRVWDVAAAARYLRRQHQPAVPVFAVGSGTAAILAAYAALWEPDIGGLVLVDPPRSHMDEGAPQFLNVLRVCDIPDVLVMLSPRQVTVVMGSDHGNFSKQRR